jgi:hypothetical protein
LIKLRQYAKCLRLGEVGCVPLPVIFMFKFLEKIKAAKFKLGGGVSKKININTFNIIKE